MRHFRSSATFYVTLTMAMISLPVSATVISVDAAGKVEIKEVKDYRQKEENGDAASGTNLKVLETGSIASQNSAGLTPSVPIVARRISANETALDFQSGKNLVLEFEPNFLETDQEPSPKSKVLELDVKQDITESVVSQNETKLYAVFVRSEAAKYDKIDVALIESVIETESNYKTTAVSPKGAMGLMQLMPATAARYDVVNAFDPEENIRGGTAELARLFDLYDNPSLALAAYNAGENAVNKHDGIPPYDETQNYVVKVLSKVFNKRQEIFKPQLKQRATSQPSASDSEETNNISKMKVYSFSWPE